MAFVEDAVEAITEGGLGVGAIVGVGALLAWPIVRPVVREGAKIAIKGGIGLYQWGTQAVAESRGGISDIVTEAQHDMDRHEGGSGAQRHGSSAANTSTAA